MLLHLEKENIQRLLDHFYIGKMISCTINDYFFEVITNQGKFVVIELTFQEWHDTSHLKLPKEIPYSPGTISRVFPKYMQHNSHEYAYVHFQDNYYAAYKLLKK